jgi:methyl-accepting chemotaxis protein
MVSILSGFEKTKNNNSFEKLAENAYFKAEYISRLIDNLPATVFRSSSNLSWGMDYISRTVEKLTGYSKMDFIDPEEVI